VTNVKQIKGLFLLFFIQHVIKLWNSLPEDAAEVRNVTRFKGGLEE